MSRLAPLLRAVAARAASRSCAGEVPEPAAPPCLPHARPACRPPPPCANTAVRIVCCAPPRGRRPPCDPRAPAQPLTCNDARSETERGCAAYADTDCSAGQDRVARRLAANDAARRRSYEDEARRLATACSREPPRLEPYAPGAARDCLRATDGHTYALPCSRRPHAPCGPDRRAPPPELMPRSPDSTCAGPARPDACAHRPRVFIEVDRDAPQPPPPAPSAPPPPPPRAQPCACAPTPAAPRGLAERIVAGLRGQQAPSAPSAPSEPPARRLHTACVRAAPSSLERALRSRSALQAAGRGREAAPWAECSRAAVPPPSSGRLDLPVPPGATRVLVLVSLSASPGGEGDAEGAGCPKGTGAKGGAGAKEGAGAKGGAAKARQSPAACPRAAPVGQRDSWLSIRSIQKKLSGRGSDAPKPPTSPCPARPQVKPVCPPAAPASPKCPPPAPPKCPPPAPPKCPPPTPPMRAPPAKKPKPSPCDRKGSSASCSVPLPLAS